jgi:hypothetical protein
MEPIEILLTETLRRGYRKLPVSVKEKFQKQIKNKVKPLSAEADSLKPKTTEVVSGSYGEVVIMGTLL